MRILDLIYNQCLQESLAPVLNKVGKQVFNYAWHQLRGPLRDQLSNEVLQHILDQIGKQFSHHVWRHIWHQAML